jgi:hypothetical protein
VPLAHERISLVTFAARILAVVVLVAFMLPTSAVAADVSVFRDNIWIGRADFSSVDGCIVTFVEVLVVDERDSSPRGRPTGGGRVEVGIAEFDECNQQDVSLAFGVTALSADEFHIDKKLGSASVTKTVEVTDEVSGASFDVSVDVSWAAISPVERVRLRFSDHSTDRISHAFEKGAFRDASVSGSVLVGTTDLLETATVELADIFTRSEHGVQVVKSKK